MRALETGATQRQRGQSTSPEFAKRRSHADHVSVSFSRNFYVAVSAFRRCQNHRDSTLRGRAFGKPAPSRGASRTNRGRDVARHRWASVESPISGA